MNISYRQLLSSIAFIFASFSVNSAIVTYNFNGFVSEIENLAQEFFDPFDLLGEQVNGSFTLDTSGQFVAGLRQAITGGLYTITTAQQ